MDLLVRLYALPEVKALADVAVRRAFAAEKSLVAQWVEEHFGRGWRSECEVAFARQPIGCFIATASDTIAGFACYDATARGFFGPIGVAEQSRRHGVGAALLFAALRDMAQQGYGYAIIAGVASADFYRRHLDIIEVPDSTPGFYRGMLRYRTKSE